MNQKRPREDSETNTMSSIKINPLEKLRSYRKKESDSSIDKVKQQKKKAKINN